MNDAPIFVFGAVVTMIAVSGGWLYVYGHFFRPAWEREQKPPSHVTAAQRKPAADADGA